MSKQSVTDTAAEWAVVTGANGGIGEALAIACARDGYNVLLSGRDEGRLRTVARTIEKKYARKTLVQASDLTKPHSAQRLYQLARQRKCTVEILINNAGFGDYGRFEASQPEVTDAMIALNCTAVTNLCRLFGADMLERRRGKVLNVASTAAFLPGPYMAVYYATKAYVLSFSQGLHEEWRRQGVTVTALCPGPTKTGFAKASHASNSALFKGKLPTATEVAEYGFKAMKKGQPVAVHRFQNKLTIQLTRVLPRALQRRLVARAQKPSK